MRPVIYYRSLDSSIAAEIEVARQYFPCLDSRIDIRPDVLVIARYSALPFYQEQERDFKRMGAKMLNSYSEHLYIADLKNWVPDLIDLTPKTWYRPEDVDEDGPYILKGQTNSRKHLFHTHMYAEDRKALSEVFCRLLDDTLIGQQNIYVRKYVPLKAFDDIESVGGYPITHEYRFFTYKGRILEGGFYWSSHVDDILEKYGDIPEAMEVVPMDFLNKVLDRIKDKAPGIVVDVAQTQSGEWIVIELNDLQMSGPSECDLHKLYSNLQKALYDEDCF